MNVICGRNNAIYLRSLINLYSPRRGIGSSCRVGVTPLRRNYTSGLRWPRVSQPWMLFPAPLIQLLLRKEMLLLQLIPIILPMTVFVCHQCIILDFHDLFFLLICNFFIQCRSFYFDFDASAASVCIFVLFAWFFLGVICHFDAVTPVKSPTK